jgi:CheY-like chemotaxis protein
MSKIALIEDELMIAEILKDMLTEQGHEVTHFSGALPAHDALFDKAPDLVISDVTLPDGSGLELVARLRDRYGAGLPVLMLTGLGTQSDILRGYAAGADEYLTKPFSRDEFLAKFRVLLARRKPSSAPEVPVALPGNSQLAFDRYELREVLGKGSYGTVYKAWDPNTGQEVALKVLSALVGQEPEARFRFLRESYAVSAVKHPQLVRITDFGMQEGRLYFAMEQVQGPTLDALIRARGPLSASQATILLGKLTEGIKVLAEHGMVHRDLKPANIILRGGRISDPVIVDFGLAKRTCDRGLTGPYTMLGTPGYIAPEIVRGRSADTRSDLYSLAQIARFALTGKELYPELDVMALLQRMSSQPTPVPQLPSPRLTTLLQRMLHSEPSQRPQSPAEVLRILDWVRKDPAFSPAHTSAQQRQSRRCAPQTREASRARAG